MMYFVNISHDPVDSNPKFTTSCRDPPAKTSRIVIKDVFGIQDGVMFSDHGDSVRPILPPRTFSVGFEGEIVPGVMFFTFTDPKIVVKTLFPILYF